MPYAHVTRKESGLVAPTRRTPLPAYPAGTVFIHHGVSRTPTTENKEADAWRAYQRYHMGTRGWSDIAYNFGVGPHTGNAYVGRGWRRQGGATGSPQDANSISICAIGDFESDETTPELIKGIVKLIKRGQANGHLQAELEILGHKDKPYSTSCPGKHLYKQLPEIRKEVHRTQVELALPAITLEARVQSLEMRVEALEDGDG